jgi:hypothetical protein
MTETPIFKTEQEAFWHGDFGNAYTDRNNGDEISRANLLYWGVLKRTGPIKSCFEIGCNRGLNLDAIKTLLPACKTSGLEINTPMQPRSVLVKVIRFLKARSWLPLPNHNLQGLRI